MVNDLTYLSTADQYSPEGNLLRLLSALLSAISTPCTGTSQRHKSDSTEWVDPYVSYMIHYESDLGDGEQVIQTSILRAFCRKERRDEKGKGLNNPMCIRRTGKGETHENSPGENNKDQQVNITLTTWFS